MLSLYRAVFGIAAAIGQCGDLVAGFPACHAAAEGDDFARDLEPQQIGGAGRRRIKPFTLHHVRAVDAGGGDFDQDFAGSGDGHRAGCAAQHIRFAWRANFNDLHVFG